MCAEHGPAARSGGGSTGGVELEEFGDLYGVEGSAFAQVVVAYEQREAAAVWHALVGTDATDERARSQSSLASLATLFPSLSLLPKTSRPLGNLHKLNMLSLSHTNCVPRGDQPLMESWTFLCVIHT